MSTDLKYEIISTSSEQTERLGKQIGAALKGGEVFELISDLGGGKTTFTRGLADGAGSKHVVASPTFTVSKEYTTPKFKIIHFDFYRLLEPGVIAYELAEAIEDENNVVVVEWADSVKSILPESTIKIEILATGENDRTIVITIPKTQPHINEAINTL